MAYIFDIARKMLPCNLQRTLSDRGIKHNNIQVLNTGRCNSNYIMYVTFIAHNVCLDEHIADNQTRFNY